MGIGAGAAPAEAPAAPAKRASRRKATPAIDPPAVTEADPVGVDNQGFMPPRSSPPPVDPGEGLVSPPNEHEAEQSRIVGADTDPATDQDTD